MTSDGESKQLSPSPTFPHFPHLPIELRSQIWQHAFHSARNSVIPIRIYHYPVRTIHSCIPFFQTFCGQHSHCPLHNSNPDQPSSSLISLFRGFFSLPRSTSEIDDAAVLSLSLACTESYRTFVSLYPETITVYGNVWYPPDLQGHECRRVRCNPATDTLRVIDVPNYSYQRKHWTPSPGYSEDNYQTDLKKCFPEKNDLFASFRRIVSSFRRVAFSFVDDDSDPPTPLSFSGAFDDPRFTQLLIVFERLEKLYICSGPEQPLTAAVGKWERVEKHDAKPRRDGSMENNMDSQNSVGVSSGILNCDDNYKDYVRVQSELSADYAELSASRRGCRCWVPMPSGFQGTWLFRSERCDTK